MLFVYLGFIGASLRPDIKIIRLTGAPGSVRAWGLPSALAVVLGVISGFVFGGLRLLRGGLVLGVSSLVICGLLVDRLPLFIGWCVSLLPAGTPLPLGGPVVGLEILSFFLRLATLAIRLLANILVGGIIVHLIFGGGGTVVFIPLRLFFVYELIVFCFQSYLFAGLSLLYLGERPNAA